jgi:hypothetical protein
MKNGSTFAAICLFTLAAFAAPTDSNAQTLVPLTTGRGMVFDYAGNYLYITTSDGFVAPYNLSTGLLETSYNLGGSLNGIDIARDDSFLLVAQSSTGISQGTFQKLDLSTSTVTNINYTRASGETAAWDVGIGSNGLALVTTQFGGSGWTPLRQIDLTTNGVSIRTDAPGSGGGGMVRQNTQVHHGADGTRFYFLESNISSGPIFTYSATSNTFGGAAQTDTFLDSASAAVNRNGNLLGTHLFNSNASLDTAPAFNFVHSFSGLDSGVAFDGLRDIYYGVNSTTNQVIAYDTNTFGEKYRLNIGEDVASGSTIFGSGTLIASPDGNYVALRTPSGIRLMAVPILARAVSRKMHTGIGAIDLDLPLHGTPAIECRSGGATGDYTIVFFFTAPLTSVSNVTITGCGQVHDSAIGTDPYQYIVNLTGVCNAQYLSVVLGSVADSVGHTGKFAANLGILSGDTTADGFVNSADIGQTKSKSGSTVSTSNFRADLNFDGLINSADIGFVKSQSGQGLPAAAQIGPVEISPRGRVGDPTGRNNF